MGRLLGGLLVLVVGVALAAELLLPSLLAARVEERVREHTRDVAAVDAEVGARPFLPPLALEGRVDTLRVELTEVAGRTLDTATVTFALEDLTLDRSRLLAGDLHVTAIGRGVAELTLTDARIGRVSEAADGIGADAARWAGRVLELAPEGMDRLEIPVDHELLPCAPDVTVEDDTVRLRCALEDVPPVLVNLATG